MSRNECEHLKMNVCRCLEILGSKCERLEMLRNESEHLKNECRCLKLLGIKRKYLY